MIYSPSSKISAKHSGSCEYSIVSFIFNGIKESFVTGLASRGDLWPHPIEVSCHLITLHIQQPLEDELCNMYDAFLESCV